MGANEIIAKIQRDYGQLLIELLKCHFGFSGQRGIRLMDLILGQYISGNSLTISTFQGQSTSIEYKFVDFITTLKHFWQDNASDLTNAILDANLLLVNIDDTNFTQSVSNFGIYFDAVGAPCPSSAIDDPTFHYLPDPMSRINVMSMHLNSFEGIARAAHHGLFELHPTPIIVFPRSWGLLPPAFRTMFSQRESKLGEPFQTLVNQYYFYVDKMYESCSGLPSDGAPARELVDNLSRVKYSKENLNSFVSVIPMEHAIHRLRALMPLHRHELLPEIGTSVNLLNATDIMPNLFFAFTAYIQQIISRRLDSLLIGAELSINSDLHKIYQWMLITEKEFQLGLRNLTENEVALISLETELKWLRNLPLDAVKRIRESKGSEMIRMAFREYVEAPMIRFDEIEGVMKGLKVEFIRRIAESYEVIWTEERRIARRFSRKLGLFVASGGLSIAGLAYSSFSPYATALTALAGVSFVDFVVEARNASLHREKLHRDPFAILAAFGASKLVANHSR